MQPDWVENMHKHLLQSVAMVIRIYGKLDARAN